MAEQAFAPAKINLTLHVTGQRDDGYHQLDSLVVFADIGDRLWFDPGPELSLQVTGPFASGVPTDRQNLVWQAAELAGWTGHITLEKNLPHGGGLGGGSADAAAVLRTLGGSEHAALLGADVPVCLSSAAQRMRGTGEVLEPASGLPPLEAILVNPKVHAATPTVFKALQQKNNPPMPAQIPAFDTARALINWLTEMRNDLEAPAVSCVPQISEALQALSYVGGCGLARMSGSGATCFGLFAHRGLAEVLVKELADEHPDWWVQACVLS